MPRSCSQTPSTQRSRCTFYDMMYVGLGLMCVMRDPSLSWARSKEARYPSTTGRTYRACRVGVHSNRNVTTPSV